VSPVISGGDTVHPEGQVNGTRAENFFSKELISISGLTAKLFCHNHSILPSQHKKQP
jgi:hypothetical protein